MLSFSTLLDIDKLTPRVMLACMVSSFSTLLDIDKLTRIAAGTECCAGFSTLLDIDKLTLCVVMLSVLPVLVLCWILINLHSAARLL